MEEITLKLTKEELKKLDSYCEKHNTTREKLIRFYIRNLRVKTKKETEEEIRQWIIEKTEMDFYYG